MQSDALSKDLKQRGFKFVGTTIMYAFMQAAGMVNDHTTDCFRWQQLRDSQAQSALTRSRQNTARRNTSHRSTPAKARTTL